MYVTYIERWAICEQSEKWSYGSELPPDDETEPFANNPPINPRDVHYGRALRLVHCPVSTNEVATHKESHEYEVSSVFPVHQTVFC